MHVAIDARILELPCPTGVERAARELVGALPGTLAPGDALTLFVRTGLPGAPDSHPSVRVEALGGPEAPLLWRETHLAPALADARADVLWSPVTALPVATRVPRVATFHEAPWLVRPGIEGFLRERAHAIRLRIACDVAARIVVPSGTSAEQVRRLHPGASAKVRVVPHGAPARFFAPRDDAASAARRAALGVRGPYVLQVGGTRPRKNVPLLLRAHARYRLRGGAADLVIAGPGPAVEPTHRGVVRLGWIDDADLLALYDGAAAVVVASESEGFGLPVLEAMARGVPVVAAAAGAVPETAGDAAILVAPGDAAGLATALLRVELDPALRALLRERGLRRAAACGFGAAAVRLVEVLREAAAS